MDIHSQCQPNYHTTAIYPLPKVGTIDIHVAVVDEQELTRIAVCEILSRVADIHFVGDFVSVDTMLASNPSVDVLLIGDATPTRSHMLTAITQVHEVHPDLRLIALGQRWTYAAIREAIAHGATGIIDRDEHVRDLLPAAVHHVHRGEPYLSPKIASLLLRHETQNGALTPRELRIVHLMHEGLSTKQIAVELNISPRTIYRHQVEIRHKLGVQTKQQIVHEAGRQGLL